MSYYAPPSFDMKSFTAHRLLLLLPLLLYLAGYGHAGGGIPGVGVSMAPSHVALSGNFHVQITSRSFPPLMLQLSRLEGNLAQALLTMPIFPEAAALASNSTIVKIPCGYFSRGGQYYIMVKKQPIGSRNSTPSIDPNDSSASEEMITRSLDVRWPMPQLSLTPEHIETYPERPVAAILEFPEVVCPPAAGSPAAAIPEFWLELHFCGQSLLTCDVGGGKNSTNQILYSEQVRGFPGRRVVNLRCELFGLAGHYALFLRPTGPSPGLPHTAAYVKVDWSEQFVFNVHARSIFPCDAHGGGVPVLFQYPSCILAESDRVRLFARLRADVAAAQPPTTLEYVGEQKVQRGRHSLHFDCDLFTERYIEYCFVYVSQAITGAVADVRMDCVPTMPVPDRDNGGWGDWSAWTPCSSTCIGGTRSRYRFCDSPPPKYGAKFCEGPAVETERCGTSLGAGWECVYGASSSVGGLVSEIAAEIPEVAAEIGPFCRCGCVVHLGRARPKRLLATSAQSCPGRTFWLIQAEEDCIVEFRVDQFRLPCGTQWLKVRDGAAMSSTLIAALPEDDHAAVNSTGPQLLLEFYAEAEDVAETQACGGGFFAVATQFKNPRQNISSASVAQSVGVVPAIVLKLTAVHIAAIFFLSGLIIATVALAAQYVVRYRKYHVAKAEDQDSLAGSNASIPIVNRASSSATLLSEVISLTRLRPHIKPSRAKHSRLRESVEYEPGKNETEVTLAKEEEFPSDGSTATLTHAETATLPRPVEAEPPVSTASLPCSPQLTVQKPIMRRSSTLTSEKDKTSEKEEVSAPPKEKNPTLRRLSNVSNATLTNGCYTSAASIVSRATIKSTNAKETKEKKNREKLMAGPGSDFSITGQDTDLEMDYYDYNVINAGAAPGSYLGMDPAFLVWIPPLDESGEILPEEGQEYHEMQDIRPKLYIDPGSNKESPEQEMLLPKSESNSRIKVASSEQHRYGVDNRLISEVEPLVHKSRDGTIQEFHRKQKLSRKDSEKETKVEKSPSLEGSEYLDDIRYADDEDDDQCNNDVSYQDSNILSSS